MGTRSALAVSGAWVGYLVWRCIMKLGFVVAAFVGAAFSLSGCGEPAPTDLQADATLSLTSLAVAPKKSTPVAAVMDVTGPIPGLPNITNPECLSGDAATTTRRLKRCIVVGELTGDLDGSVTAVLSGEVDLSTFASVAHGHFTLDVCHADFGCGAFEGPFKGEGAPGGQGMLTGNGHGTGDFHTMQLRLSVVERATPRSGIWTRSSSDPDQHDYRSAGEVAGV